MPVHHDKKKDTQTLHKWPKENHSSSLIVHCSIIGNIIILKYHIQSTQHNRRKQICVVFDKPSTKFLVFLSSTINSVHGECIIDVSNNHRRCKDIVYAFIKPFFCRYNFCSSKRTNNLRHKNNDDNVGCLPFQIIIGYWINAEPIYIFTVNLVLVNGIQFDWK